VTGSNIVINSLNEQYIIYSSQFAIFACPRRAIEIANDFSIIFTDIMLTNDCAGAGAR